VNRILTIDLALLNPYFQGTTSGSARRSGFISVLSIQADRENRQRMHRLVQAKSFDIGPVQGIVCCPGISDGRSSVVNSTNAAFEVGSARLDHVAERGRQSTGLTIDQASTQRSL
jgi:hypothetical protein